MNPATILALFQGLVGLIGQIAPVVAEVKTSLSSTDQATLDATLTQLDAARVIAVGTAVTDLDAAAQET